MSDDNPPGLEAVPNVPDEEMVKWLRMKFYTSKVELLQYQVELAEVMQVLHSKDDPPEFGYARLLNNLSAMDQPRLIRMLSALLWEAAKP